MTQLQNKLRHIRLFELFRQRGMNSHGGQAQRVSRLSEGEGEAAILLRRMAARSLATPRSRWV